MKLTSYDKDVLSEMGFPESDFWQIEQATLKKHTSYELDGKEISLEEVLELMDRKTYLSGIGRSAFHYTSVRETRDGRHVYFNSRNLFK